jgi:hypothetical protein
LYATLVGIRAVNYLLLRELNLEAIFEIVHSFNRSNRGESPACLTLTLINYWVHVFSPVNGNIIYALDLCWRCLEVFFVQIIETTTSHLGEFVGKQIRELIETHVPGLIVLSVVLSDIFHGLFEDGLALLVLTEVLV